MVEYAKTEKRRGESERVILIRGKGANICHSHSTPVIPMPSLLQLCAVVIISITKGIMRLALIFTVSNITIRTRSTVMPAVYQIYLRRCFAVTAASPQSGVLGQLPDVTFTPLFRASWRRYQALKRCAIFELSAVDSHCRSMFSREKYDFDTVISCLNSQVVSSVSDLVTLCVKYWYLYWIYFVYILFFRLCKRDCLFVLFKLGKGIDSGVLLGSTLSTMCLKKAS